MVESEGKVWLKSVSTIKAAHLKRKDLWEKKFRNQAGDNNDDRDTDDICSDDGSEAGDSDSNDVETENMDTADDVETENMDTADNVETENTDSFNFETEEVNDLTGSVDGQSMSNNNNDNNNNNNKNSNINTKQNNNKNNNNVHQANPWILQCDKTQDCYAVSQLFVM